MTTSQATVERRIDRWSGGCLIAADLLLLPNVPHPNVFHTDSAHAALHTGLWVPIPAGLTVGMILSVIGLLGLYRSRAQRSDGSAPSGSPPVLVPGSRRASATNRTARSRSSSGYFLGAAVTLILTWIESLHQTRHGDTFSPRPGPRPTAADRAEDLLSG